MYSAYKIIFRFPTCEYLLHSFTIIIHYISSYSITRHMDAQITRNDSSTGVNE